MIRKVLKRRVTKILFWKALWKQNVIETSLPLHTLLFPKKNFSGNSLWQFFQKVSFMYEKLQLECLSVIDLSLGIEWCWESALGNHTFLSTVW